MKYARWSLAYLLYYAGHLVSKLMYWRFGGWFYRGYNCLMIWSTEVQGPGEFGPWKSVHASDERDASHE